MPTYSFSCGKEECHEWEGYLSSWKDPNPTCSTCGGASERVWRVTKHAPASVFPYITTNIDPKGRPIEVTSASHLDSLCKQYGLTHRPDVGWLTKEHVGYNLRTGKQEYKESSGVGLPGCWV